MEFGANLRELRESAKMTQAELAEKIGVTRALIAQYELGSKSPTVPVAARIAQIFGVTIDRIANGEEGEREKA